MYSFIEMAHEILKNTDKPLTSFEIWGKAVELKLDKKLNSKGKTPWDSLGARLYVEVRDNPQSKIIKVGKRPARFYLKEKADALPQDILEKIEKAEEKPSSKTTGYYERDLHPLLSYFAYTNPSFNRGKAIYTKTIFHEKSKKRGYNEWLHPDMVGFYVPLDDWSMEIIELNKVSDNTAIRLYSFELKKIIDKSNYRESFFQAVSNSSWANEGYLVAAEIKQDDELLSELERLSISFGIGIIQLDITDIDASSILYHAQPRKELDWETMNKLSDQNDDFSKFLQDVKIDYESRRIHKSEYDKIIINPEEYIKAEIK
jgi:uncharacterized protein